MAESNPVGRVTLTELQLKATEIMLYRAADLIDRLLADNKLPYTKIQAPVPMQQPQMMAPPMNGIQGGQ